MSEDRRRSLGRGLSALFQSDAAMAAEEAASSGGLRSVPIEKLRPSRFQPRRHFAEEELEALAQSIRENGIVQPILVRAAGEDAFEIVAGERRWRAAQRAQLHEVPVVVRELEDRQALELALVENIQRQDLNAIEEAEGYRRLMDEFGYAPEALGRHLGRSRSHVANMVRLLGLPAPVRALVEEGVLSAGHARALLNARNAVELARRVAADGLSVRETERLAGAAKAPAGRAKHRATQKVASTVALERELGLLLGLAVSIEERGESGRVILTYRSLEQLDDLLARLRGPAPSEAAD